MSHAGSGVTATRDELSRDPYPTYRRLRDEGACVWLEAAAVVSPTDDGMGAFMIALIAFGGVLAIGGLAFVGVRVAHHGQAAH